MTDSVVDSLVRINRAHPHESENEDETNVNINQSLVVDYFSLCYFDAHMCVHLLRCVDFAHTRSHGFRFYDFKIFFFFPSSTQVSFSSMWLTSVKTCPKNGTE